MFGSLRKSKRGGAPGRVGLLVSHDGFTLCHVVRGDAAQPRLERVHHVSALTRDERSAELAEYVEQNGLAGTACVLVLPSDERTLGMINRPQVEENEIAASLPFLVKDFIDFDPADAQIDYFDVPQDVQRGREPQIFVGAARRDAVSELAQVVSEAGLALEAIDIAELALRNIAEELPEQVAGTAILDLGPKSGRLVLCHEAQLYFSRSLGSGSEPIDNAIGSEIALDDSAEDDELSHHAKALLDELLLEIQRSLDYYESVLGKAPASRLVIGPSESEVSLYVPYLSEQLRPVSIEQLDLNTIVDCDDVLRNETQTRMLLALGAGLRDESQQQIDLKPAIDRAPSGATLPFKWVAPICAGVLLLLLGLYGLALQKNAVLDGQVEEARARRDTMATQIAALESQLQRTAAAQEGVDPLASERAARDASTRRLRALEALGGLRREGFSRYFAGLAKRTVDDLWIEKIEVHDGGASLSIRGKTLEAKRVPQLLRKLRSEPSFEGKTFSLFELESAEGERVLSFALESAPTDPATETMR